MDKFAFRDLRVYQNSKQLAISICQLLKHFPPEENFALNSQLRRAVFSVPSNFAEGMGRVSKKERVHFIEIAYGSLMEVLCQLEIAVALEYLSIEIFNDTEQQIIIIAKQLSRLKSSILSHEHLNGIDCPDPSKTLNSQLSTLDS